MEQDGVVKHWREIVRTTAKNPEKKAVSLMERRLRDEHPGWREYYIEIV